MEARRLAGLHRIRRRLLGCLGLVFGGIVPAYGLAVRELFPANQAQTRTGVIYFFGYIGMGGGGLVGGAVYDVTLSYPTAFAVGVAFNLVNIGLILFIKALARARAPLPAAA